ncbi:hypothetical protein H6P81_014521 [Aristolochia fimbriata]|uniref:DUF7722 domain-containing protein n=1 Tax=Aristolochia fimbriata TaxID=158543 RepID=A0AAV7EHZ9_ARIFI|nr:hypothetical protein H6P81_014521 [Aristolochia fimbriata]
MESIALPEMAGRRGEKVVVVKERCSGDGCFQMPLHYPRYTKADYETMPEWKLDSLLREYGLPVMGDAAQKRMFAMGAFLWPSY